MARPRSGGTPHGPVVFLMGPTAAGKTDVALQLHQVLPVEIISVDSAMVYRGMDIGTAKPSPEVLAQVPHRLVDVADPRETYSAGRFRSEALEHVRDIQARGRVPLLVGGTGLYFRALERGLSPLPPADPEVRRRIVSEAEADGWAALHARLAAVDPEAARRIEPGDGQRIQRALEVFELTGVPMTVLLASHPGEPLDRPVVKVVLAPAVRDALYHRIDGRFRTMLREGLVEEVAALRTRGDLHADLPSMRAVGYRQVWDYLDGRTTRDELEAAGATASRHLAKRQLTWLKAETGAHWVDALDPAAWRRVRSALRGPVEGT